ncbi:MAG: hypothetical protein FJW27_04845 [Acidimicrobiia bacterium]|nr:hypothetical protein [Acidimicrobiia bacterium]
MPLTTYEQVRPWARSIKARTGIGPKAGVMPPWYVEHNIGIQQYKNDPSLSELEIALIAQWADSGAPLGDKADLPPAREFADDKKWIIGTPDPIVKLPEITVKAAAPDWWGEIPPPPVGLTEDRYVAALEIKGFNDVPSGGSGRATVGGRYVFHHMIWSTDKGGGEGVNTPWPVHEVGRNADTFDPRAGRLLRTGSNIVTDSVHLHSNGRDTKGHLEIGFKLHPKDYKPTLRPSASRGLGKGVDISIRPMEANQ